MAKHVTVIMKIINLNLVELVFYPNSFVPMRYVGINPIRCRGLETPPPPILDTFNTPLSKSKFAKTKMLQPKKNPKVMCKTHKTYPKKELLSVKTHIQEANFFRGKVDPCGKSK